MAAHPGEENVATVFGDVHYFYSPESDKPRHHRFDKGSYVYLFENANERRARIEIANQPGTDDQDAFEGFLDKAHIKYSYKHSCLVSITVGETRDQNEWHLPTYDPRNEKKYHYKLHSLDIYFWTQKDALQFANGIRSMLPPSQVEVLDEPGPPATQAPVQASGAMSPVVQQLEKAAISDPAYGTAKPAEQSAAGAPPPISTVSQSETPANYAPMAYNPAAPAAPETVRHREKTPPPDDDPINPLAMAVAYDYQQQPFSPGFAPHPPGPPGTPGVISPGFPPPQFGGPPPHPGIQRSATMPVHAGLASPGLASPYGTNFPGSPGFAPPRAGGPPQGRTPPVTSPGLPPPPPGGYSHYSYNNAQGPGAGQQQNYAIHQQLYRPTEGEAASRYGAKQKAESSRLERGVGGMLKKFEKKFG